MKWPWKKRRKKLNMPEQKPQDIKELFKHMEQSDDFSHFKHQQDTMSCWISFYKTICGLESVHREILPYIFKNNVKNLMDIKANLPIEDTLVTKDLRQIQDKMLEGHMAVQMKEDDSECLLIPAPSTENRQVTNPETETSIVGPKEGFVESLDTNINLVRKRLPLPNLYLKETKVGKLSKTRVSIIYIKGIANQENVNTVWQRIKTIEFDQIVDSSTISQIITDSHHSPFPQFIDTERPDRTASAIAEGKIAILVDGSPHAVIVPTTIVDFFIAFDDYFITWHIASFIRLIRLAAVTFSVFSTPLYVAILTYHYEVIPRDLLATLISSRAVIPFPPIFEALILELTIELLREAGARLPTKVGQTIGIVGGLVIGTASVQAGLASNVLLIIVAMAGLASFTTPNYRMGNTIRLIRFPFLIAAQLWGLIGIALCFGFYLSHLLKLTSLGRPYVEPFFHRGLPI